MHEVWGAEGNCRSNPACLEPPTLPPYLVPGREAASALVPCDLGIGLSGNHAVQIQGLPFSHVGGRGLNVDGLGQSWGCGHKGCERKARILEVKAGI